MSHKIRTQKQQIELMIKDRFEGEPLCSHIEKQIEKIKGFIHSYDADSIGDLNLNQLKLLYVVFSGVVEDTDRLFHIYTGSSVRGVCNTANALVRRGFVYWDIQDASNRGRGNVVALDRYKIKTSEYMCLF